MSVRLLDIGPRTGKLADVHADPTGWVDVYQDAADGHLAFQQRTPAGDRRVADVPFLAAGGNAFPRLYVDARDHTWLAWRHDAIGGILFNVTTGQEYWLGFVYGNAPIGIGDGRCWYQRNAVYQFAFRELDAPDRVMDVEGITIGKPDGIATVAGGWPVLVADVRLDELEHGLVNPQYAADGVVGENADTGPDRNIARLSDGRVCVLWSGITSFTPRIDDRLDTFAIVTSGGPGVRLALVDRDADFAVPPPAPTDEPFEVDPNGIITDTLPYELGASPARSPESTSTTGEVYKPKNNPPESESRRWDRATGWITHTWDQSRFPDDPGWFWMDNRWIPLTAKTGDTYDIDTELWSRVSREADPERAESYTVIPFRSQIRVEVGRGRYNGFLVELVLTRDNRKGPRPAPLKGRLGRQEKFFLSKDAPQGGVRFEEWKDNEQTGTPEMVWSTQWPSRVAPYEACPRPSWAPDWTPPTDPPEPPQPPEPDMSVNAIPQDVTARAIQELRTFCRTYEFNGAKPYEPDVTDTMLVDGLLYFMFETWMPIMATPPNPGSLPGWEARRHQADAALQSYMRRRVGDTGGRGEASDPLVPNVTTLGEQGFVEGA